MNNSAGGARPEPRPGGARKMGDEKSHQLAPTRALLLYILPLPLLAACFIALMAGHSFHAIAIAVAFALAMFAATLVRKGLDIEHEARRRKIVRRSSTLPYKTFGASVLGVALFIGALFGARYSIVSSLLLGVAACVGSWLVYGRDPARGSDEYSAVGVTSEEVLEILNEADTKIAAIEDARGRIHNTELKDRLRDIIAGVREIMGIVEDDPADLRRARKFLRTYLDGAQRVTEGYADMHQYGDEGELEEKFRSVLTTIETVIVEQKEKLRENNLTELDVQIEVLQLQLEKEGV